MTSSPEGNNRPRPQGALGAGCRDAWAWLNRKPFVQGELLVISAFVGVLCVLVLAALAGERRRPQLTILYMACFTLLTFGAFGLDRWFRANSRLPISRPNLLALSFLGGSVGAVVGMALFRDPGRDLVFRVLVPTSLLVDAFVFGWLIFG